MLETSNNYEGMLLTTEKMLCRGRSQYAAKIRKSSFEEVPGFVITFRTVTNSVN